MPTSLNAQKLNELKRSFIVEIRGNRRPESHNLQALHGNTDLIPDDCARILLDKTESEYKLPISYNLACKLIDSIREW